MSTTTTPLAESILKVQRRIDELEAQRIKNDHIAKACGIDLRDEGAPNYFGSLDAMAEAEKQAPMGYGDEVRAVVARDAGVAPQHICDRYVICATAEQRAEAFGNALNLW